MSRPYKIKVVSFTTIKPMVLKIYKPKRKCGRKKSVTMTERERSVLEYRFGLIDGQQRSLAEVGRQFNVSRERIRQIEANALRKMGVSKKRYARQMQSVIKL